MPVGSSGEPIASLEPVSGWANHLHVEPETSSPLIPSEKTNRWPADSYDTTAIELLERHGFLVNGQTTSNAAISQGQGIDRLTNTATLHYLQQIFAEPRIGTSP